MSTPNSKRATIYDPLLQGLFEDWVLEADLKVKFNVATYYIETESKKGGFPFLRNTSKLNIKEKKILKVLTNQPGYLIGRSGEILKKYTNLIKASLPEIDEVEVIEVKDQERILRGVKKKLRLSE